MGPRVDLDAVAKRKIPCLCQESNPGSPARSVITTLTELSRLQQPISTSVYYIGVLTSSFTFNIVLVLNSVPRREDVWGSSDTPPRTRWRWVVSVTTPAVLPAVSIGQESGRTPGDSLDAVAKRNNTFPTPCQESNPGRPAPNIVTILTELPLLSFKYLSGKSNVPVLN
jgi:hypothetical protein